MRGRAWDIRPDTVGRYYSVGGRNTAAATGMAATLWNPSSTRSIWCVECESSRTAGLSPNMVWVRTVTRGTPASTVTPDVDNDFMRQLAPNSGAVLDLGLYTVDATEATPALVNSFDSTSIGSSERYIFPGLGIRIPPGTGFGMARTGGTINPRDFYFVFRE